MDRTQEISIHEVDEFIPEVAEAIRSLAKQEGKNHKELSDTDFREMVTSSAVTLFIAKENQTGKIVGMVTLIVCRIPYVKKSVMEDLVVDELFRGRGIGTMLIDKVVTEAKRRGAAYLDFSSRPRREGENKLYEKLGFKVRETNVYRQIFDYGEV